MATISTDKIEVFFSYSHSDAKYAQELQKHFSGLRKQGLIEWHDRDIDAGKDWESSINEDLNNASIILLLISPSYMASDYCYSVEMKRALERHETRQARVIPILIRPTVTDGAPFRYLQSLPPNHKPVSLWGAKRDEAFVIIVREIKKIIDELLIFDNQEVIPIEENIQNQTPQISQSTADEQPFPRSLTNDISETSSTRVSQHSQISAAAQGVDSSQPISQAQNAPLQVKSIPQNPSFSRIITKEGAPDAVKATADKAIRKLSEDKLGFAIWIKALRNFIVSQDTTTPLTIGIDGAWGTGKTSFMFMLQDLLEPSLTFWEKLKIIGWPWFKWFMLFILTLPIWSIGKMIVWMGNKNQFGQLWIRDIGDCLSYDPEIDSGIDLKKFTSSKRFWAKIASWHQPRQPLSHPTIWFNAWKFDQEEQLWAALVLAALDQIKMKYNIIQRIMFWIALTFKRFSWVTAFYYVTLKVALPIILGILAWKFDAFIKLAVRIYPNGSLQSFEPFFPLSQAFLWVGAGLSGVMQITNIIKDPFQIPVKRLFDKPDYKEKVGFIGSFERDFSFIVSVITRTTLGWKPRKLVIFIDDLDRCKLPKAVDVIEGINLFLDSEQCVFVIGMDTTAVIASVETKYQDLFQQMHKERPEIISFGRFFLDKIIQIPLHIPRSTETTIDNLVRGIIEFRFRPLQMQQNPIQPQVVQVSSSSTLMNGSTVPKTATKPLQMEQVDSASYTREDVRQAILLGSSLLPENPRQVKRFINLFRLYVYIVNEQKLFEEVDQTGLTMNLLAIWVAWSLRWEKLVRYLSEEVSLQLSESTLPDYLLQITQSLEKDGSWMITKPSHHPVITLVESIKATRAIEEPTPSHWSHLPWERWLRDRDFLKCVKELESFWQQPAQTGRINWLQTILLMTRITLSTNIAPSANGNAQLLNSQGTSTTQTTN